MDCMTVTVLYCAKGPPFNPPKSAVSSRCDGMIPAGILCEKNFEYNMYLKMGSIEYTLHTLTSKHLTV